MEEDLARGAFELEIGLGLINVSELLRHSIARLCIPSRYLEDSVFCFVVLWWQDSEEHKADSDDAVF